MLNSLAQSSVTHSDNHEGYMASYRTLTAQVAIPSPKPNYLKWINRCGIRRGDKVLVIGGANVELLQKMAQLIGTRGEMTVLDNDESVIDRVKAAASEKMFTAFKHFSGGHPAFDMRSNIQKYQPVKVSVSQMLPSSLPYSDKEFDVVWVDTSSDTWLAAKWSELTIEFERVAYMTVKAN